MKGCKRVETSILVFLNGIAVVFITASALQGYRVFRAAKKCAPIHKSYFRVKQKKKRTRELSYIITAVFLTVCWIAVAEVFIPWEQVSEYTLEWLPITHFNYPDGLLTFRTISGRRYELFIAKKYERDISSLLADKLPA